MTIPARRAAVVRGRPVDADLGGRRDVQRREGRRIDRLQPLHGLVHAGRQLARDRHARRSPGWPARRRPTRSSASSWPRSRVSTGWRIDNGELVLVDGDDKELLRFSEASPVGAWKATMFRQRDAVASLEPGTEISAVFDEDGDARRLGRLQHVSRDVHDRRRRDHDRQAGGDREGLYHPARGHGAGAGVPLRAAARGELPRRGVDPLAADRRGHVRGDLRCARREAGR